METINNFIVKNYILLIIITVILFLALIGYLVDESDRKKGISVLDRQEEEKDIHALASNSMNKSLNTAVTDNAKKQFATSPNPSPTPSPTYTQTSQNNTITDLQNNNITNNPF